jgi:hypothetical protein
LPSEIGRGTTLLREPLDGAGNRASGELSAAATSLDGAPDGDFPAAQIGSHPIVSAPVGVSPRSDRTHAPTSQGLFRDSSAHSEAPAPIVESRSLTMLSIAMIALGLAAFAAMLAFVEFCDRV